MQTVTTIEGLRAVLAPLRGRGKTIGLVPTMGYLHVGHMELVRRARAENDVVVASIFVNPLQFGAGEDLTRYPRDLPRDQKMLQEGASISSSPPVFPTCIRARWPRSSTFPRSVRNSRARCGPAISPAFARW